MEKNGKKGMDNMLIRTAKMSDLSAITAVEEECFPVGEAAAKEELESRLQIYPNHFWLLEDDGKWRLAGHFRSEYHYGVPKKGICSADYGAGNCRCQRAGAKRLYPYL